MGIRSGQQLIQCIQVRQRRGSSLGGRRRGFLPAKLVVGNAPGVLAHRRLRRAAPHLEQRPRLGSGHGRYQHPVAGAVRLLGQGKVPPHLIGHLLQPLIQVFGGIGHHQPVPGPGHGHVEHPQLFRNIFRLNPLGNGLLGQAGVAAAVLPVQDAAANAQRRVHQHVPPQILPVEPAGQVAQEHHRVFQALGLMDAEDAHRVPAAPLLLPAQAPGLQPV